MSGGLQLRAGWEGLVPMNESPLPRALSTPLETLEHREMPAAVPWIVEPFQRGPVSGLPSGWSQWSSDGTPDFAVDTTAPGLGDQGRLRGVAPTGIIGRAWLNSGFAADVETSAAVYLSSAEPAQLFIRGRNLNGTNASYYAASVMRGAEVRLTRVLNGTATVLGTVKSEDYISSRWVTLTIRAEGDNLKVFLHRGDRNQYLGRDGVWTRHRTAATEVRDTAIRTAGQVGFARNGQAAGEVVFDSLRVGSSNARQASSYVEERFSRGEAVGLPAGWQQWSNSSEFRPRTDADETLRMDAGSAVEARAWLNRSIPSDAQLSASLYVDSLIPAGIISRGSNLSTNRETGYQLTVKRGLDVQLSRIVNGTETRLATIRSRDYLSGLWVQASVITSGDSIRVQVYRSDTGQYLKADGTWSLTAVYAMSITDTAIRTGNSVGLVRGSGYAGQLVFDNFLVTTTPDRNAAAGPIPTGADKPTTPAVPGEDLPGPVVPPRVPPRVPPVVPPTVPPRVPPVTVPSVPPVTSSALPSVPRNYSHIRVANLAYFGTPLEAYEQDLLRNSVDLVIPNLAYLEDINAISPTTPQFVYTNVSNIYLSLITDWNDYADRNRLDREVAFYHVNKATAFNGMSASAVPVERFWGAYRGTDAKWDNLTRSASNTGNAITFAERGESLALGFLEKYREINVDLSKAAGAGFTSAIEYVSAVDATGKPTRWSTLRTLSDTTNGLKVDGRISFDPPRDWVAASVGGSARLFYTRIRTTGTGTPPAATTVLGRNYTAGGMIPAFDAKADRDGDGYLNDAEYAKRTKGFDARFEYEGRLFYPNYGPMRFATNISHPGFRGWAVDYHVRFLATQPLADGFFVDNSIGRLIVDPTGLQEKLDTYPDDYGSLLGTINRRLMANGKWLIANTAGGNKTAEPILRNGVSYLEEFALRPMSANHVQFDDLAATVKYRRQLAGGKAYEILDSLPNNGFDANDPRLQIATLAMYYLVADANLSMLMINGGNEPASTWRRHWIDAIKFNVGRAKTEQGLFATGVDPADNSLVYKVYQRSYQNALVLYKPLAYTRGKTGTTADNTRTTHQLERLYRPLRADGTLGTATRTITLRNGEGAVLVPA